MKNKREGLWDMDQHGHWGYVDGLGFSSHHDDDDGGHHGRWRCLEFQKFQTFPMVVVSRERQEPIHEKETYLYCVSVLLIPT